MSGQQSFEVLQSQTQFVAVQTLELRQFPLFIPLLKDFFARAFSVGRLVGFGLWSFCYLLSIIDHFTRLLRMLSILFIQLCFKPSM